MTHKEEWYKTHPNEEPLCEKIAKECGEKVEDIPDYAYLLSEAPVTEEDIKWAEEEIKKRNLPPLFTP